MIITPKPRSKKVRRTEMILTPITPSIKVRRTEMILTQTYIEKPCQGSEP